MGELSEDVLTGRCCGLCGVYFSGAHGYPVVCRRCWLEKDDAPVLNPASLPELGPDTDGRPGHAGRGQDT